MRKYVLLAAIVLLVLSGCYARASFILPPNTELMINGERISLASKDAEGRVKLERRPFFWTSIMGIEYTLLQGDTIVKKDKLPSAFRVASIFWPPYAYIYWPVGFRFNCYDLSNPKKEFIERCAMPATSAKKNEPASPATQ